MEQKIFRIPGLVFLIMSSLLCGCGEESPEEKDVIQVNQTFPKITQHGMELKIISVLRLMFPDRLIPASLDVAGIEGMVERLNAGANVVTSIISADSPLEGVVNFDKDVALCERQRDAKSVIRRLETMGMARASAADFEAYLNRRRAA